MHSTFKPRGIYSAQWIPIDSHGHIDQVALAEHIAFERRAGISGILALGSTGEFPHFSPNERKRALEVLAELAGTLPVMANITDIRPKVAIELGLYAKSLGMPAVALMPPVFYPMAQADVLAYFLHVADAVGLPVMLYNFPELTGKKIDLSTVSEFARRAPMIAIKQSGSEFAYHRELIALGQEMDFAVMSGADTRLPEVFRLGAAGCIGGLVNMVPEIMVAIYRISVGGEAGDLRKLQSCMVELGSIMDQLAFPLNIAGGIEARGFRPGTSKAVVSATSRAVYESIIPRLHALFEVHGLIRPVPSRT